MSVDALVDHLFRRSAGRMIAVLTRVLGPSRLDLAEEVVQDALVRALETWPYRGVPADPQAWLFRVARNRAVDVLRRENNLGGKLDGYAQELESAVQPQFVSQDDELAMIFMCCHPVLPRESQIAFTLKTVGGFSVPEIAAAFLAEPPTIAQRIVRAKRTISERGIRFELPADHEIAERIDVVLDVLYLMFNEGYDAHFGEVLVREESCGEAIRLARLLVLNPATARPKVYALLSLMLLQASRLAARRDDAGDVLLMADQDRRLWDRALIVEGLRALASASSGEKISVFHVQAAIASHYATAPSDAHTNWSAILKLYDQLYAMTNSPVVQLNRAIALAKVDGPDAGIHLLEQLREDPAMRRYSLLPAALAGLWLDAGRPDEAVSWYKRALELPGNDAERRFLQRRLAQCEQDGGGRPLLG